MTNASVTEADSNVKRDRCLRHFRTCAVILVLSVCMLLIYFPLLKTKSLKRKLETRGNRSLTVVSAYFNIGSFRKGLKAHSYPEKYLIWARSLTRMLNPLVFYTDDLKFKLLIERGRRYLPKSTTVIFISNETKSSMWSFGLKPRIEEIYSQPSYPKHYPSTVSSDYACVQHAKYELVVDALQRNLYPSNYYAWLDIGYFRRISKDNFLFRLEAPSISDNKIAYCQVEARSNKDKNLTLSQAIRGHKLWVGGGMFIGTEESLITLYKQYQSIVKFALESNLMDVDQTIIYAMFTDEGKRKFRPLVEPQVFVPPGGRNPWFYLGYYCLRRVENI